MDSLKRKMWEFHKDNPHVMDLVEKYTFEAIRRGFEHYSINSIFERIRWHEDIETEDEREFKLSNNHRAYYARYFHHKHPEYEGFFRTKETRDE
tara:strand:- start:107 stop:388 length:282 start_codon:yes stop_codon:yes gene_type:complete